MDHCPTQHTVIVQLGCLGVCLYLDRLLVFFSNKVTAGISPNPSPSAIRHLRLATDASPVTST